MLDKRYGRQEVVYIIRQKQKVSLHVVKMRYRPLVWVLAAPGRTDTDTQNRLILSVVICFVQGIIHAYVSANDALNRDNIVGL
jgi:hypothetical protein